MPPELSVSYVIPVHNSERVLRATVARLRERLDARPGSEILLVENGSRDSSPALVRELAAEPGATPVRALESPAGLGHALRAGMAAATGDVVVLSAADLPMGFSDLDAWLALPEPRPRIAIGSKGHPGSTIEVSRGRRLMSEAFRLLRLLLVGLRVRDSQGPIVIERDLAHAVLPHLGCGDFLISTEVVCWAAALGAEPVELAVVYRQGPEPSTVRPLRDSTAMALGLWRLRRRLPRRGARPATLAR